MIRANKILLRTEKCFRQKL